MSRHLIHEDGDEGLEVFVGWDPPLQGYFLQELVTDEDGEEHERTNPLHILPDRMSLLGEAYFAGWIIPIPVFHALGEDRRLNR